jgi:hypothetical protein
MAHTSLPSNVFIVVPARDEHLTIGSIVRDIRQIAETVVVVDDHSRDNTSQIARESGALVIQTEGASGYGAALTAGLRYARTQGCSAAITIDGDGAHVPSQLLEMYEGHRDGQCDLTLGNRFTSGHSWTIPTSKRLANYLASHLFCQIFGVQLDDVICGFRVLSSTFLNSVLETSPSPGFGFVCDLFDTAISNGCRICTVPVDVRYDARSLLCTNQEELLEALNALVTRVEPTSKVAQSIFKLLSAIANLEPITIGLPRVTVCAVPIPSQSGYIFQAQHPYFSSDSPCVVDF